MYLAEVALNGHSPVHHRPSSQTLILSQWEGLLVRLMNLLANHMRIMPTFEEITIRHCSNDTLNVWLQRTVTDVYSWGDLGICLVGRNARVCQAENLVS